MSVSAATSTASATTAIFDSKDNKQEVSDVVNDTSNNVDNDNVSNGSSSDSNDNNMSNNDVFLQDARDIMNWVGIQKSWNSCYGGPPILQLHQRTEGDHQNGMGYDGGG